MKELYLAGGCFWGTEAYLEALPGVLSTEVGYSNGKTEQPSYEEVCHAGTGHAETVKVVYDEKRLPLAELLDLFYLAIDPTARDRQGNDVGRQYRSGIYYVDEADLPVIQKSLENLQKSLDKPLAVEAVPLQNYSPAEEEHQKYLQKHPGGYCHIDLSSFDFRRMGQVAADKYEKMPENAIKRI